MLHDFYTYILWCSFITGQWPIKFVSYRNEYQNITQHFSKSPSRTKKSDWNSAFYRHYLCLIVQCFHVAWRLFIFSFDACQMIFISELYKILYYDWVTFIVNYFSIKNRIYIFHRNMNMNWSAYKWFVFCCTDYCEYTRWDSD